MNNSAKMSALLRELRPEMNGAVVESMQQKGINYSMSYGVTLHTIRQHALEYAPDDAFAKFLLRQDVRELKIAAFHIADAATFHIDDLALWCPNITTIELAENWASMFLARVESVDEIIETLVASDVELLNYAAVILCSKRVATVADSLLESVIARFENSKSGSLRMATENLEINYSAKGY